MEDGLVPSPIPFGGKMKIFRLFNWLMVLFILCTLTSGCKRDGGAARVTRVPVIRDQVITDLGKELSASPQNTSIMMKMAARYSKIGSEAEAESTFEKILRTDPYHVEARAALADIQIGRAVRSATLGKDQEARDFLARAEKLGAHADVYARARASVAMARYKALKGGGGVADIKLVQEALQADPTCSAAHVVMINSALESKDIIAAAEAAAKALRALPDDIEILRLAASVDLAAGNVESATKLMERAAGKDPAIQSDMASMLRSRGTDLLGQKRYQEAIEVLSKARITDPGAAADLARAFMGAGNLKSARQAAQEAVALNPNDETSHFVLGDILAAGQDIDGAMAAYSAVLQYRPESLEPHFRKARLLSRLNRLDEAIGELEKALAKEPGHIQAAEQVGVLHARAERYDKALEIWEKILSQRPDYANVYYDIALLKMKKRDFDEAIVNYSRASQLEPGNPLYLYSLGLAYRQKGLIDESIEAWKGVLTVAPESKYAQVVREMIGPETARKGQDDFDDLQRLVNYAVICEKSGKREEAFKTYARALAMAPQNARVNLGIYPHFIEAGDHIQALASILVVLSSRERTSDLQEIAGEEYVACGMIRKGMSVLNRGLEVGDIDRTQEINGMIALSGVLEKRKSPGLAAEHLLEAAAMDSRYDLMIRAGDLWVQAEEYDKALGIFSRVASSASDDAQKIDALVKSGAIGGLRGDMTQACRYFDRALEINAVEFQTYLRYGEVLRKGRRSREATMVYQRLLNLSPPEEIAQTAREILRDLGSASDTTDSDSSESSQKSLPQWEAESNSGTEKSGAAN
ncbi:MAG: hypothetical protein CVV64_01015 [Candidatus Wallbacteria bacterium HGW-Wallbacteria-1]|jgi:tetratricopeptide (TPR) repeat protein|uniref:Uncharacterized protein n=1 Tax=Candidatus Wallbacteria bacterium HGW-Wallbacteria-1 TaxID=2013854 RepID=A0A2N1PUL1_9BACT|nr:MAG: hypothetical protein CVV64_01015 [Candidatus Wallbacteria bacterium HGW-Wallbacteria-1]